MRELATFLTYSSEPSVVAKSGASGTTQGVVCDAVYVRICLKLCTVVWSLSPEKYKALPTEVRALFCAPDQWFSAGSVMN